MRIALVSLQFEATTTGGGGIHVEKITEYLREMGHQVTVLSIHTGKTLPAVTELHHDDGTAWSQESRGDLTVVRFLANEDEQDIEHPYVGDKHTELERILSFCDAVAAWLQARADEFDAVHLHGHHAVPGYLAHALRAQPFQVVSTIHYLESTNVKATSEGLVHYQIADSDLVRMKEWEAMARFADATVIISPGMEQDFIALLEELDLDPAEACPRLHMVASGIDPDSVLPFSQVKARLAHPPERIELLAYARLDPVKGIEYAIQAAAQAATLTDRKFRLTVAGVPEEEVYLPILEREMEKARQVVPVEFIIFERIFTPAERNAFLDHFHVYLFPSLREPYGLTVIETGARGLVIISSDSPGPSYILDGDHVENTDWGYLSKYGILVKRTELPERHLAGNLAQALAWSLENWENTASRVLAFHQRIEGKLTWVKTAEQFLALYKAEG